MPKPEITAKLPYADKKEKRKIIEEKYRKVYERIYEKAGRADVNIDDVIHAMVDDTKAEKEYLEAMKISELMNLPKQLSDKYFSFKTLGNDNFVRILDALRKPEDSVENIQYNEMLARKSQTRDGCVEILQEAVTLLANSDKRIFQTNAVTNAGLRSNYNSYQLGFVAINMAQTIDYFRTHYGLTEEEIPMDVSKNLMQNKRFFENGGSIQRNLNKKLDENNLFIPEDITTEMIVFGKLPAKVFGVEFVNNIIGYANAKGAAQKGDLKDTPYIEGSDTAKAFYARIQERLNKEKEDYAQATKEAEERLKDTNFISDTKVFQFTAEAPDAAVKKKNQKLIKERFDLQKDQILELYNGSLQEGFDAISAALEKGNIRMHSNPNYKAMMESVKTIKEFIQKKNLSADEMKRLGEELENLDSAADGYVKEKMNDKKEYSDKALDRIDAARLCKAFAKEQQGRIALIQNDNRKIQLITEGRMDFDKRYSFKDAIIGRDQAIGKFGKEPTPENFAVIQTFDMIQNQLEQTGEVMNGRAVMELMQQNMKVYSKLAETNKQFKEALETGFVREARNAVKKIANDEAKKQEAQKAAEKEKLKEAGGKQKEANLPAKGNQMEMQVINPN